MLPRVVVPVRTRCTWRRCRAGGVVFGPLDYLLIEEAATLTRARPLIGVTEILGGGAGGAGVAGARF